MRLLLTADLHYRIHWFRWLIEQAPNFDLICIAGDLLDMFRSETRMEQAREIRTLVKQLADVDCRSKLRRESRQCWPTRLA
jgi:Icc-related predicted phosphoesterase